MTKRRCLFKNCIVSAALYALASYGSVQAEPLHLSNMPLSVSASVEPNVMLLIDNSGSMKQMTWAGEYDPNANYDDWSNSGIHEDCFYDNDDGGGGGDDD